MINRDTKRMISAIVLICMALIITSCDGIFDGVYDSSTKAESSAYGFKDRNEITHSGLIYVDATSYTKWIYINFHTFSIDSAGVTTYAHQPQAWDIAVHRYDAKTNGGSVAESNGEFKADVFTDNKVITDMSGMMQGKVKYASTYYNEVLSRWLSVDKSSMPPIYTMSGKTYIVKLTDGTRASLKLDNFMDASGVKGFLTIEYVYPL